VDDLYERQKRYYHLRAGEYDATAWEEALAHGRAAAEIEALVAALAALPPAPTLDVACGTGFLTAHLPGELTLLDASADMLAIAAERVPGAELVHADALPLPFADGSFERVFSGQFYDHLRPPERERFLAEARRVASELVLCEQSRGPEHREGPERRALADGSVHEIYTTYFGAASLLAELGGGELLHESEGFLVVRRRWRAS
jgi:ubiquinone/menaquinone biosynthesis C-methylase UbiE